MAFDQGPPCSCRTLPDWLDAQAPVRIAQNSLSSWLVVAKYLKLAADAGLKWPLPGDLDDAALEKRLYRQPAARAPTFAAPDYAQVHQELKRKGVTLLLLWEEYRQAVGDTAYQYTAFCTHYRKADYATVADHMPAAHRAHAEWSPGKLMNWAATVGPATGELVKRLLLEKLHPEQGYRSCLGLMRLARTVGRERMEAACTRALAIGAHRYRSVASILDKGLDRQPVAPPAQAELALPEHANVRGPDYYH